MHFASEAVHMHATRSPPWCVGSLVVLGDWAVLLCGLNYPVDCVIKTVHSNHGFFITTDSTTP